ncbi:peptidoglycan DD-metalloendopeptidase family protein [Amphiplicatus metriothermophilus]|uniref:BlaR1 peptidase M56 n=1 Tax=Amphiplicatus metriothermophilus TaxID=1519374 RepID=A0A239PLZ4_9PROT|nr:peptidoglycan DD-metalloendopeptidase family protein [Amphiplicatus metriothermophilus]MBB5517281.1 murein DD-endopeptidase MepM/ murein hydrolase activator NlpD [Amphiplicatus metriothermophilus]SNT68383.1 BlaR1 peptidase M56 [Amphiplicatus metriothermophilus]
MTGFEMEPAILCLLASLLWAPIVYAAATRLDGGRPLTNSETLWLGALLLAAAPTLIAPALAAAGVSLRPAAAAIETAAEATLGALSAPAMQEASAVPVDAAPAPGAAERALVLATTGEPALAAAPEKNGPPAGADLDAATVLRAAWLIYAYGLFLFFGLWAARALVFAASLRRARPLADPGLAFALEDWRRRLGVAGPARLKQTEAVSSVCVYGLFRPAILIPADIETRMRREDVVMMCAHELAHIRRGDGFLFAALRAARLFFWFNPFVARIAARAELAAEQSADALVLERGADRRAYAACFVESLRFAAERARSARALALAFTPFDRRSRRMRLDAILSGAPDSDRPRGRLAALGAGLAAGALAFAQAAFAVAPDRQPGATVSLERLPVNGPITLDFAVSFTDGLGRARRVHQGVDIRAPRGAPVTAPADGVIVAATDVYEDKPAWGKVVVIDHGNGLVTRYAHLDSYAVRKGDRVKAGQTIARVGATGDVAGPHLHFETLIDGTRVDPLSLVAAGGPAPAPEPEAAPAPATEPAPAPRAPEAPRNAPPAWPELSSDLDGEAVRAFVFSDEDGEESLKIERGKFIYKSKDGEKTVIDLDGELAEEERAKLDKALEKMRAQMRRAREAHAEAMERHRRAMEERRENGLSTFSFDFDGDWFAFDAKTLDFAGEWADEWRENMERAREEVERARERALEQAERARERALAIAEAHRLRAEIDEIELLQAREKALREAEERLKEERKAIERERRRIERERARGDRDGKGDGAS